MKMRSVRKTVVNIISRITLIQSFVRHRYSGKLLLVYTVIFATLFLLILPYLCQSWVYSWYFQTKRHEKLADDLLSHRNEVRRQDSHRYLEQLDGKQSRDWHETRLTTELDVVVIVKTVDRTVINSNPFTGYLTQTATALDREIRKMNDSYRVGYFTCNVDPHPHLYKEPQLLDKYYISVVKHANNTSSYDVSSEDEHQREKEKKDYMFCLQSSTKIHARYVLMIEDDTEPYENVFIYLKDVIENRLERRLVRGEYVTEAETNNWAFIKLYYPERWAGYGREVSHICELFGVGALTGSLCVFISYIVEYHKHSVACRVMWIHMCVGLCLGILVALSVGRQHIMQLRRVSPTLLTVNDAPGCCTPAVLYKANHVASIVKFLKNVRCSENYGVDLALDDYTRNTTLRRYLIQPNLFHHRGVYSTLTKPKNRVEFLFDA